MYCATPFGDSPMRATSSSLWRVLTEMSTGVMVTFFQGALRTMLAASGSHHQLNSRRYSAVSTPPPISTSSLAFSGSFGSSINASAILVSGPPPQMTTSPGWALTASTMKFAAWAAAGSVVGSPSRRGTRS